MRNIIRTVNELPNNYSGHLTILLNDREPVMVIRNILLLLILGTASNTIEAAELALHFWYSAFYQLGHSSSLLQMVILLVENVHENVFSLELGKHSNLSGSISSQTLEKLHGMTQSDPHIGNAKKEIKRVRWVLVRITFPVFSTGWLEDSNHPELTITTEGTVECNPRIVRLHRNFVDRVFSSHLVPQNTTSKW
jgi:hypothetical protein